MFRRGLTPTRLGCFEHTAPHLNNSRVSHLTHHRRTDDRRRCLNPLLHLPSKDILPPSRPRHPRHPIPREGAQSDRLQQRPTYLPNQHSRTYDADQASLALLAAQINNAGRTREPASTSCLGKHERTSREHHGQRAGRLVFVPSIEGCGESGHEDV